LIINPLNLTGKTDKEGYFRIKLPAGKYDIFISHIAHKTIQSDIIITGDMVFNFDMPADVIYMGEGVTVTASRSLIQRSNVLTATPVDIVPFENYVKTGDTELSQLINNYVPSFVSGRQTFADGTDHVDPAMLRGLSPDQVLVLINGKRRHSSALLNVTPIVGKGTVGTDLNAIPAAAIERIEVLKDGSSPQYGTDAIAGVINIILKSEYDNVDVFTNYGVTSEGDGETYYFGGVTGSNIGNKGFFTLSGEMRKRGATNRAREYQGLIYRESGEDGLSFEENFARDNEIIAGYGRERSDYNLKIGNSEQTNSSMFFNSEYDFDKSTLYSFGGLTYRQSRSAGFYRFPNESRNNKNIYPHGFLPYLTSDIFDKSLAVGMRGKLNDWNYDLSNSFGGNSMQFGVDNSLNVSYGDLSPTTFNSGTVAFNQNTTNFDLRKNYADFLNTQTFIVSFGTEFRLENFRIIDGDEASWSYLEEDLDRGAQVFSGFRPENATNSYRHSMGGYIELESDITRRLLASASVRFDEYSDFGSNLSGKFAARYQFAEQFSMRGSVSNGFRAPSLHQLHYEHTSTFFYPVDENTLIPLEIMTANNSNRAVRAFGVGDLKAETAKSYNIGITSKLTPKTFLTIDAYQVDIEDRIVLSGYFPTDIPGVNFVQFFSNAIDTRTQGIDIVLTHEMELGLGTLGIVLAGNFGKTEVVSDIKMPANFTDPAMADNLFNREERARIETGSPKQRMNVVLSYSISKFDISISNYYFGEVTHLIGIIPDGMSSAPLDQSYAGKWLTDLTLGYNITDKVRFYFGGKNIFNVYPDENKTEKQDFGRFPYNTAVTQFGFNGSYFFGGINLRL